VIRPRWEADEKRHTLEGVGGYFAVFPALESDGLLTNNPIFYSVRSYPDADVRRIKKAMYRHVLQVVEGCAPRSGSQDDTKVRKKLSTEEKVRQVSAGLRRQPNESGFSLTGCNMVHEFHYRYQSLIQKYQESSKKAGGTFIELGTRKLEQIWADIPADTSSADALEEDNPFSDRNASELDSDADATEEGNPFSDGNKLSPESDDRTL